MTGLSLLLIYQCIATQFYYCVSHFFVTFSRIKRKDAEPEILTVDEVKRIFSFVKNNPKHHSFIPVLAVGFFCGARVEERAKLIYADIYIGGRNEIFVSAAVAKNGIARFIYPTENVKAWMDFAKKNGVSMNATDTLI